MEKTKTKIFSSFSFEALNKIIVFAMIVLGIFYIAGTNDLSIKGFALNELKLERNKLADENNKLELQAMNLSSYNAITERVGNLKMVAVGSVDYISTATEAVAKK